VLEGVGGLRKSTMVEILGGTKYYSDTPFEVGRGKEAQEQVQGLWVYEIAEMTHFSKADIGAIKAFISSKVDRYRVAYGATVGSFARQCVLVGTTNENTYLRDRTGNRRFWPVPVRQVINTEWLIKYRDQLLAEAYAMYAQGAAFTPTPDAEKRLFAPMQESRLVETAVVSELLFVLTRPPMATGIQSVINDLASFVTIAQLVLALGVDAAKSTPALEAQVRGWLDHEGWERVKRQINGTRAWGYVRPNNWPPVDVEDDMTAAVPSTPADAVTQDGDDVPF
jgi:putative DNA primase/helicase